MRAHDIYSLSHRLIACLLHRELLIAESDSPRFAPPPAPPPPCLLRTPSLLFSGRLFERHSAEHQEVQHRKKIHNLSGMLSMLSRKYNADNSLSTSPHRLLATHSAPPQGSASRRYLVLNFQSRVQPRVSQPVKSTDTLYIPLYISPP